VEDPDRFVGERAVGTSAVRDHFFVPGQLAKPAAQLGERDRDGARQMARRVFLRRPYVQHEDVVPVLQPSKQLSPTDRLQRVACSEIGISELAYFGTSLDSDAAEVAPEVKDLRIVEGIADGSSLPPSADQADFAQHLQVLTGIGNRDAGLGSQALDRAFAVREDVQDLETSAVGERLAQAGELIEERRLGSPAAGLGSRNALHHLQILN